LFDNMLDVSWGGRTMRPSDTEQKLAGAALAALAIGVITGSRKLQLGGAAVLAGVAYAVYEEAQTFVAPETMNAHFLTNGQASAMNGPAQAAQLAGVFQARPGRRSSADVSYAPMRGRGWRGGR
jgi:uncharacterized membrane protein YebE (DUF533 family)